jgi:hypothetical protein
VKFENVNFIARVAAKRMEKLRRGRVVYLDHFVANVHRKRSCVGTEHHHPGFTIHIEFSDLGHPLGLRSCGYTILLKVGQERVFPISEEIDITGGFHSDMGQGKR